MPRAAADSCGARAGDGKCVICDSYVRPATLVRVCDECNYGSYAGRCVICGGNGISDAYYCKECTMQEKDVRGPQRAAQASPKRLSPNAHAPRPAAARRETAVRRLSTWAARRQTCSTRGKNVSPARARRRCTARHAAACVAPVL